MAASSDHSSARPPTGSENPDHDAIIIGSGIGGLTTAGLHPLPASVVRCVMREEPPAGAFHARVNASMETLEFDADATDFYLCGSAAIVALCWSAAARRTSTSRRSPEPNSLTSLTA